MTSSPLPPSFTINVSDQPPTTPPATATSFLSFSPSPPAPPRTQVLAPPIDLTSLISAVSTASFDLDAELALSPDCSTTNLSSRNPFLAILIAQRAQSGPSPSPTASSASSLSHSHSTPSPSTSTASLSESTSERSEREKREEREEMDSVVIYDGSSLRSGDFSSMLDETISEEAKEWEEDTGSAWEEELYSGLEETALEGSSSPPATPILSVTPSSPPSPLVDETPRAHRVNPKIHHSPSPRRKSVVVSASSPRSRTRSTRSSPRNLRSPTSSTTSRRASLLPIDAFSQNPTSPILLSTTSPHRSRTSHPFGTSTSTLSPRKSKSKSKKSKKPPRSPPHLRPIRKTAEGFDADALDQLFGVPRERRRKNRLIMEGEAEEWRKVEEFRGLLEEGNRFETETESEEEEVSHIRTLSTRTRAARKREKARPPPLNFGIHTNSFASQSQLSSFSPDSATLDGSISSSTSAQVNPLLKEIERRRDGAKDRKRVLRGKKSVGERLRGLCGISV